MRRRLLVLTGILLAVAAVALTAGGAYAYFWESARSDLLASGITVAGVDVGGLHASDARALLEQRLASRPGLPTRSRRGWIGFWDGAGIHGTDETWSIGHAASHGCIRMTIADVEQLYPLVRLGTPIYVD